MHNDNDDRDSNNFRTYIGFVAEDLADGSDTIKVSCPELTPNVTGEMADRTRREVVDLTDAQGKPIQISVYTSNTISATWWGDTNRMAPPNVVKGELVKIYQYANSDKYYWESAGRYDDLRKTERIVLAAANSPNTKKDLSEDNTYSVVVSTKESYIKIQTSKSNGESYKYTFLIDAKKNIVQISDDVGNEMYLNSDENIVRLANRKGTLISANSEDIILLAPRDIVAKAGKQVLWNTPTLTFNNTQGGGGVTQFNTDGIAFYGTQNIKLQAPTISLEGDTKINGTCVTGPMRAEGYATGAVGEAYAGATTDIVKRSGNNPTNTPDTDASGGSNRHAAAQEDMLRAVDIIRQSIHILEQHVGVTTPIDGAVTHTETAIMNRNRGE